MLGNNNLLEVAEIRKISNGAAAGTATVTATVIDLAGFDAVTVVADLAAVVDGCVLNLSLEEGALANGSDAAALNDPSGAAIATGNIIAAGSSNTVLAVDVARPGKRYITAQLARGTQNATLNTMLAILYRAKKPIPLTQGATVLGSHFAPGT